MKLAAPDWHSCYVWITTLSFGGGSFPKRNWRTNPAWQVQELIPADMAREYTIQSVVGRIVHTRLLPPEGRFHMDHLNSLLAVRGKRSDMVGLTSRFKRQLHFWLTMLIACLKRCTVPPRPSQLSSWAVQYLQMLQQWAGACCEGKQRA
jgi:hypothetical protein